MNYALISPGVLSSLRPSWYFFALRSGEGDPEMLDPIALLLQWASYARNSQVRKQVGQRG